MKAPSQAISALHFFSLLVFVSCASTSGLRTPNNSGAPPLVRSDYTPGELKKLCAEETNRFVERLDRLSLLSKKDPKIVMSFENTFGELESAFADFQENLSPLILMSSVSVNADVRRASEACQSEASQASIEIYSRKELFDVMKQAQQALRSAPLPAPEIRLIKETMTGFKLNGLELPSHQLEIFKKLQKEMSDLAIQFDANLNNNTDSAEMTESEMSGIPDGVKARFIRWPNGNYKIPAKATYYLDFMENAANAKARRKMAIIYNNREAQKNTEILQKTIRLRREAALLLGFKDWADYRTYDKMAKTGRAAWDFLGDLKAKMGRAYQKDYQELLAFKKITEPQATKLDPWDTAYYSHHLKIKNYAIDDEAIRDYFPSDHVVSKMFEIYSQLLGLRFSPVIGANTWHPSVQLFEIHESSSNALIAYFYTDLYPREGKYNHAAAFPIRTGREVDGRYLPPIAAIVANLTPATADHPSLLSHDDVETLFHEFGHVMHMTLTKAKFSSLAGTSVAGDFVEAPSQMLENWVWQPQILKIITAHHADRSKKMPNDLIKKLIRSRKFNQAYGFNGQLLYGIYDLTLHRSPKDLDVTETYKKLYKEIMGTDPLPDTHWPASFGHIMGGYDAGYYGYLWSNVYAFDMFTLFENGKLLSPEMGQKYRKSILEKGNLQEAMALLQEFLGRRPNSKAFFRYLGIK